MHGLTEILQLEAADGICVGLALLQIDVPMTA